MMVLTRLIIVGGVDSVDVYGGFVMVVLLVVDDERKEDNKNENKLLEK